MNTCENFEMLLVSAFMNSFLEVVRAAPEEPHRTMGFYLVPPEDNLLAIQFVLWDDSGEKSEILADAVLKIPRRLEGEKDPAAATFEISIAFGNQSQGHTSTVSYQTEGLQPKEVAEYMAHFTFTAMITGEMPPDGERVINTTASTQSH